jgi:hypothetical protein
MTTSELEESAMRDLAHIGAGMTTGLGPARAVAMLVLTACGIADPNYIVLSPEKGRSLPLFGGCLLLLTVPLFGPIEEKRRVTMCSITHPPMLKNRHRRLSRFHVS